MYKFYSQLRAVLPWRFLFFYFMLMTGLNAQLSARTNLCNSDIAHGEAASPNTIYYADSDGDGFGDAANFIVSPLPAPPPGYVVNSTDCNDNNVAVYPGATEACNNIDDDCDGSTDEGLPITQYFLDADGDTWGSASNSIFSCLPTAPPGYINRNNDCDDSNAAINPQASEICNNVDDDCDNVIDEGVKITFYQDGDGDTYGNNAVSQLACTAPSGYVTNNNDCNDNNAAANPGASEVCNGLDDDCDNFSDNGLPFFFYYQDSDVDNFGNGAVSQLACSQPLGYVLNNTDCDDNNAAINPAAQEICNGGIDDDCDGLTDNADPSVIGQGTYYFDGDGDSYGAGAAILACLQPVNTSTNNTDCDDGNAAVNPAATEICNSIDDDCDGSTDEGVTLTFYADSDGDTYGDIAVTIQACYALPGYVANNTDCNDAIAAINPGAQEICDGGIDNDCDGLADDNDPSVIGQGTYYADDDGDSYGAGAAILACIQPLNTSTNNTDCNDAVAAINPGAQEICDGGIDNDCDGLADDNDPSVIGQGTYYADDDGDSYGAGAAILACIQPLNTSTNNTDCNDAVAAINPGAQEICDGGIDNDCDGLADDNDPSVIGQGTYYADDDGDSYGAGAAILACIQPLNTSTNNTDCNDGVAAINPGAQEICDGGIDNDCDGLADDNDPSVIGQGTYYADGDGDSYGAGAAILACIQPVNTSINNTDCNDAVAAINPGAQEICDGGIDNDCDGLADDADPSLIGQSTYYADGDGDSYGAGPAILACVQPVNTSTNTTDCNDAVAAINPGAQEICDGGIDNDCDGLADDADPSIIGQSTYYSDGDGDSYGAGPAILACVQPLNTSTNTTDCNDAIAAINPGAQEICDGGIDNDCDGLADDVDPSVIGQSTYYADGDGDSYGAGPAILACVQPVNTSTNTTDCDDNNAAINPGAQEICDGGIDNDCDGLADDVDPSVIGQSTYYADGDGDSYGAGPAILACVQPVNTSTNTTDCDDNNAAINPAAQEICNGGVDDDCDGLADDADPSVIGQSTYYADGDGDSYGAGLTILACVQPVNTSTNTTDCDDNNAAINPVAQEICNGGIDDDCDGLADDADPSVIGQGTYYADGDGDSYGAGPAILACVQPVNTSTNNTDCDDNNAAINPGAQEICDGGIDNDCDGLADDVDPSVIGQSTYYADGDGDSYGAGPAILACVQPVNTSTNNTDCNDGNAAINPGVTEICNNVDDDCNGLTDDGLTFLNYFTDADGDSFGGSIIGNFCQSPGGNAVLIAGDCDDNNPLVNPSAIEVCNGTDDDCNGLTDDGLTFITYYADVDGDTYGNPLSSQTTCSGAPSGYVINNGDCDDMNSTINPAATEICNGVDDDCDGITDGGIVAPLGAISGPAQACIPVIFGTAYFSVTPVPGITTYTWTLPAGLTIVSGQGTSTIFVSWTASAAHDGIAGVMSVVGSNNCGAGTPVTTMVDMHYTSPVRPPSVSGNNKLCPGDLATFSITLVARATSYTWVVPAGITILTGQGTNIITVSVGPGFVGGSIDVYGSNVCGDGAVRSKTLTRNILGAPAAISGQATGLCGMTGIMYSTAGAVGATSYIWSVPSGATITGGQGTAMITVDYTGSFTSGSIIVYGSNTCGGGASRNLSVIGKPNGPGPVTGDITICPGATNVQYDVSTVAGAATYTWIAPSGATIASGQGTKTVYINYGTSPATNLTLSLTASNACGTSGVRVLGGISINSSYCGPRMGEAESIFSNMYLFPNPATDRVTLQFDTKEAGNYRFRLLDISGRLLLNETHIAIKGLNQLQVNTTSFSGGIYLLELETGGTKQQTRLVIE